MSSATTDRDLLVMQTPSQDVCPCGDAFIKPPEPASMPPRKESKDASSFRAFIKVLVTLATAAIIGFGGWGFNKITQSAEDVAVIKAQLIANSQNQITQAWVADKFEGVNKSIRDVHDRLDLFERRFDSRHVEAMIP